MIDNRRFKKYEHITKKETPSQSHNFWWALGIGLSLSILAFFLNPSDKVTEKPTSIDLSAGDSVHKVIRTLGDDYSHFNYEGTDCYSWSNSEFNAVATATDGTIDTIDIYPTNGTPIHSFNK
jgi:hypothetical protein